MAQVDLSPYQISEDFLALIDNPKLYAQETAAGRSHQQLLGWSDELMLDMYEAACRLMQRKEYQDAADAFIFLITVNPNVPSFWIGASLASQGLQDWEEAFNALRMGIVYGADHFPCYSHWTRLCLEHGSYDQALAGLDFAISVAEAEPEDPKRQELGKRAWKLRDLVLEKQKGGQSQ